MVTPVELPWCCVLTLLLVWQGVGEGPIVKKSRGEMDALMRQREGASSADPMKSSQMMQYNEPPDSFIPLDIWGHVVSNTTPVCSRFQYLLTAEFLALCCASPVHVSLPWTKTHKKLEAERTNTDPATLPADHNPTWTDT